MSYIGTKVFQKVDTFAKYDRLGRNLGTEQVIVELHVDVDQLLRQLGWKAFEAKGKQSRLAGGLIKVKVLEASKG